MRLTQQTIIRPSKSCYKDILDLCHRSKNLYNTTLYAVRRYYFENKRYLPYVQVDKLFKETNNVDYRSLPSQTAQQTMKVVDQSFRSFFRSLKLPGHHSIPHYKEIDGVFPVTYTNQQISNRTLKNGYIKVAGLDHRFPTKLSNIKQVRFIPRSSYIVMEVIYEVESIPVREDNHRYAAIDLGIDNLATLTFNDDRPLIINGKPLKSINQYYNKKKADYQSRNKNTSLLTLKRNNKIRDYFHKSTRFITNQLVSSHYNTLVIGYNKGWKQDVNLGTRNNQSFVTIPFLNFVNILKYKCELQGIRVILREESYTSKASFLDRDPIENTTFSGKRIKRGLYKSKKRGVINADVNGSYNIMRKEVGDVVIPADRGFVFNPLRISF